MAYLATRAYIEAFVGALSNRTDIEFVEGDGFGVNLREKKFMYDPILLQSATIDEVKGILLHEVGHLLYTKDVPDKERSEVFKKYPCLTDLYNACEDVRIEHLIIKEFKSFADGPIGESRLYAAYNNYIHVSNGDYKGMTGYKAFGGTFMTGLMYFDKYPLKNIANNTSPLPFHREIADYSKAMFNHMVEYKSPDMKKENLGEYFKPLKELDWFINKIDSCKNTKEVMDMVDTEIVPHIEDLLKHQDAMEKAGKALAKALHGAMEKAKEGKKGKEKGEEASSGKFKDEGFKGSRSLLDDLITGSKTGHKYRDAKLPTEQELENLYKMHIHSLTRHLNSVLQERTTIKYAGAYKRGKLLPRNVYKARTDERRMYSKRKHFDTPYYEVSFLLDESGSMRSESRYEDVYVAGFVIDRAVRNLKFKTNYVSWDDQVEYHEKYSDMRDMGGGGNDENRVLQSIAKKIDYNNEQIIFLLTDGGVDSYNSPRPMLDKFKKIGVHVIPIGINIPSNQEKEFKKWYPESVLIKNVDELSKAMSDFLKKIIHR